MFRHFGLQWFWLTRFKNNQLFGYPFPMSVLNISDDQAQRVSDTKEKKVHLIFLCWNMK